MDETDVSGEGFVAVDGLDDFDDRVDLQRAVFQATPVPTVVVDMDRRTIGVNDAFRRLFGFESQPVTMADVERITHPDDVESTKRHRTLLADGATASVDKLYVRPDGTRFWGHLTATPLIDGDGRRWGVVASIADVTDRVEAQSAAVESEQRFRALVQHATDAIVVLDERGRLVYATPSGERLTGNRSDDVVGSDIFQYVHPDDRDVVARSFASIFDERDDGPNIPLQFRVIHNDGSVRFVEAISTNLLDDPAVNGVVVNIRDLTDSAVALSALELTENRFRRMIENISDTITLLDAEGRVVQSTGNLKPILGYPPGFWNERNIFELVHPDDVERIAEGFVNLSAAPGAEMASELRVRAADGSWADAEVEAVNLLHDPDVGAVVLTTRNISDRKRAERELNEARDQAMQALQMRTEFIASVSHELRSPIHGVLGLSELLASTALDADARQLAQSIGRATETLRMVLDDILDFSRIEVGRLDIAPGPVLVSEVASDLTAFFGPEAAAKGLSFVVEADDGFPTRVRADGLRVRQVVTNLVSNAVKFTASGEVRVRASCERVDGSSSAVVRIEVSDTGIGIPREAHDRLFRPFSQAHPSTSREFGGSGLGLSIAKRLVELMGGELGFESEPGQGSTFWFLLPVEVLDRRSGEARFEVGPGSEPTPTDALDDHRPTARVMVVEDNAVNQLLVRRQLERLGFEAVVFDTGAAAIEQFAAAGAAVVLMDRQLPGIDGIETTRRLRAIERDLGRARTPIVAMTASALPGDRERCLSSGMDDFIAKPVSMVVLGEVIRRWVASTVEPQGGAAFAGGSGSAAAPVDGGVGRTSWPSRPPVGPPTSGVDAHATGDRAVDGADGARLDREADPVPGGAIDIPALDRLVEDLSDPQLVASVLRTYLRELRPRLDAIERAWRDRDAAAVEAAAHVLRSTSAAIGAQRLATQCEQLERGPLSSGPELVDGIRLEADAVETELSSRLSVIGPRR